YDRYGRGGWGLYADEGSSFISWRSNLVFNTKTGSFHQHYGASNIVQNNILAFGLNGQLQRSRVENHLSFWFRNNIVDWDGGPLFTGSWADSNVVLEQNLYWNGSGSRIDFNGLSLAQWQATGKDRGSVIADPQFMSASDRDFRLADATSGRAVGFVPFDFTRAGVYGDSDWRSLPHRIFPAVEFAPEPPPEIVSEDFENVPIGNQPPDAQVSLENKGDSIAVSAETAAAGRRSLKLTDVGGLRYAFNPHFYYTPNHLEGTSVCSFDIRVGPSTYMYTEWRDDASPYRVGPSLSIRFGRLSAAGTDLMAFPVN
ncbi:MAG: right-handed parallel beta-helix repeat-containing protein, partial [Acidobacteria bacterium]|nr:right-handed parallel beta-helix repeat-containing protein [Acidobacteriota bacterium]